MIVNITLNSLLWSSSFELLLTDCSNILWCVETDKEETSWTPSKQLRICLHHNSEEHSKERNLNFRRWVVLHSLILTNCIRSGPQLLCPHLIRCSGIRESDSLQLQVIQKILLTVLFPNESRELSDPHYFPKCLTSVELGRWCRWKKAFEVQKGPKT